MFIIGTENFGIGQVCCQIDQETSIIKEITIEANSDSFTQIINNEQSIWHLALYPPKIYFREIPFELIDGIIQVNITEEMLDEYDIALYFDEHYDITGILTINKEGLLTFEGLLFVAEEEMNIKIVANP